MGDRLLTCANLSGLEMNIIRSTKRCTTVLFYGLPYVIGQTIYIFILSFVLLSSFSSPNLSSRRLDVCHTSTHGVALVRI